MTFEVVISLVAAAFAVLLGGAAVARKSSALASWLFLLGMLALAADAVLGGLALHATDAQRVTSLLKWQIAASSFIPGSWLCFSLIYSRGNASEFLARWRWLIVLAVLLPPAVVIAGRANLIGLAGSDPAAGLLVIFGGPARLLSGLVLVFSVLVLVNLERTIRAAVGTVRWRVKYLFIGAGLIFGVRIYTSSQGILLSTFNPAMATVEAVALLIGCALMTIAYARRGFGDLDIYPSRAVLQGSITIALAGGYLFVVGLFAQVVAFLGMPEGFPAKAFIVLIGFVGLAILVFSDRVRTGLKRQITRHFGRPQHDSRTIWTKFTRETFGAMDNGDLCRATSKVISGSFDVLSIRIFLVDPEEREFSVEASTFDGDEHHEEGPSVSATPALVQGLEQLKEPVELDSLDDWIQPLLDASPGQFAHGGKRLGVPLRAADRLLGVLILADRVNGIPYTQEERDLLGCLGDQLAANLLNLRLTEAQVQSKQLEAFQTMATFFVHDLKNAANSLGLMLQNLPTHFDDPEFRKDALRGLGKSADRINSLIAKLSTLRSKLDLHLADCDLNQLVQETIDEVGPLCQGAKIECALEPLPAVPIDHEQMQSVLTNLVVNASEALEGEGCVRVGTTRQNGAVVVEVSDDGCGMSAEFIRNSLFQPFQSTKSKGLGIGMFQSKMVVEAHKGTLEVESEPGKGSRFVITIPVLESSTQ